MGRLTNLFIRLGWVRLDWVRFGWVRLDWVRLGSIRFGILSRRNNIFLVDFGVFCFNLLFVFVAKSLPATGVGGGKA